MVSAAFVQLAMVTLAGEKGIYPTIGASGGIFGVLLAFGMLFPNRIVVLLFPPIPLPAWLLVTLYGLLELTNGVLGTEAGVAHFAHLGGMLGAYLELQLWRRHQGSNAGDAGPPVLQSIFSSRAPPCYNFLYREQSG